MLDSLLILSVKRFGIDSFKLMTVMMTVVERNALLAGLNLYRPISKF